MVKDVFLTIPGRDPQEVALRLDPEEAVAVRRESKLKNTYLVV